MLNLKQEQYKRFFEIFDKLCSIPHGSGNTKAISDFCAQFAKERGLSVYQDELNNVVIKKPATKGFETHEPIILQGHLDMVCEKEQGCKIDFEKDGLDIYVDGDYIAANGTTLGGDDGIAVAMVLSILEEKNLSHPEIEAVFTTDEETGMYGADGLDANVLKGKMLINIDSENEGVFTVSCAGGARAQINLPLISQENNFSAYEITVDGLLGGHSGVEIDKGRINANILLGEILNSFTFNYLISEISGGLKDNAIPRSARCIICSNENPKEAINNFVNNFSFENDNKPQVTVKEISCNKCFSKESSLLIVYFLNNVPNGIQKMSSDIKGLVQTSLNLGILNTKGNKLEASFAVRSSVNSERNQLIETLKSFVDDLGGTVSAHGFYPAWEYKKDSKLRQVMCDTYKKLYNAEVTVEAIHAGLECGLFGEKIKGLDAVSIGPNMCDIHTPGEKLSISSSIRVYEFLCEVLKNL